MSGIRAGHGALALLMIALFASGLAAQEPENEAQAERLRQARSREVQPLLQLVDQVQSGAQEPPAGFPAEVMLEFLKASEGQTYVPFTIEIPRTAELAPAGLVLYLRVSGQGTSTPAATSGTEASPSSPPADDALYAFEDVHFVDLRMPPAGQPYVFSRAFAVRPGPYTVYVGLRERGDDPSARTTVLQQAVDVPDFWIDELTTSSLILAERLDPLSAPLTKDEQLLRPFALGSMEVVPATDTEFLKSEVLSLFFVIYNTRPGPDGKPDVVVDYSFYTTTGQSEAYFNKTSPQEFNAQTLPAQFDPAAGHQLVGGQSIPLSSFPEGEYRLEVKVTDRNASRTVTRNATFSVVAPAPAP